MTDYAPEAMPSVQLSPIVMEANRKIAANALKNLSDGQIQLALADHMLERYDSPRKAAVVLMMIARQCELAPWEGDRRK